MATQKNTNNKKLQDLEINRKDGTNQFLNTNQGVRIKDNQNSLKAGERGATLLEDFIMRDKITISIMKGFRKGLFMLVDRRPTAISRSTNRWRKCRFSVKFCTNEGMYNLVGNNMPGFFIQDAIKFPVLSLAVGRQGGELVHRLNVSNDTGAHLNSPSSLSGRPAGEDVLKGD
jgi:catalase